MFSRLARRSASLAPLIARCNAQNNSILIVARCASSSTPENTGIKEHVENWDRANKLYYGPERDTVNYPHPKQPETNPETRLGVFPKKWFDFLYDKTGVTGPYVFGAGALTFLLSKEIWVIEHGFMEFVAFWIGMTILIKKIGPGTRKYFENMQDEYMQKRWYQPMQEAKEGAEKTVKDGEHVIWQQDGQKHLFEAKRENVDLQLEAIYRQRLSEVHHAVKRKLDYQFDLENAKRSLEQKHMVNWIVGNVVKGITPQQEKESIAKCIKDLKGLAPSV